MLKDQKEILWKEYQRLGESALGKNHYDLAAISDLDATPNEWKQFLMEPDVKDYINSEMAIIQEAELQRMTKRASESRSTGQAQLMTAIQKMQEKTSTKEGPVFVYCYVPLSTEQEQAPNVIKLDNDPFLK